MNKLPNLLTEYSDYILLSESNSLFCIIDKEGIIVERNNFIVFKGKEGRLNIKDFLVESSRVILFDLFKKVFEKKITFEKKLNFVSPQEDLPISYNCKIIAVSDKEFLILGEQIPPLSHNEAKEYFKVTSELSSVTRELHKRNRELKESQNYMKREHDLNEALAELYMPLVSPDASLDKITSIILDRSQKFTGSKYGYVSSIDPATEDMVVHTHREMIKNQCNVKNKKIFFPKGKDGLYPALWGHSLNTMTPFYTNSPKNHPASAGLPKGHVELKNFLSVPVILENKPVGQLALANSKENYTEKDLEAICRIAEYYALAIQRKRVEEDLLYRLGSEELIGAISNRFVNINHDNIDAELKNVLKDIALFTGSDYSFIYIFSKDRKTITRVYEWAFNDEALRAKKLLNINMEKFPWLFSRIKKFEEVLIPSVSDLPPSADKEKESWEKDNIKSVIAIPLVFSNNLIGYFGVFAVGRERIWKKENIITLKVAGEIFVNVFIRLKTDKALIESEKRYRNFISNFPGIAFVGNMDFIPVFFHGAVKEITGYEEKDFLKGKPSWDKLIHPEDMPEIEERVKRFQQKKSFEEEAEYRIIRKNGEIRWVHEIIALEIEEPLGVMGVMGVIYDITERKSSEEELEKYRTSLEELVVERTEKLKKTNESLKEEIYRRKKIEDDLQERLLMEGVLVDIMSGFINIDFTKIDKVLRNSLRLIGEFINLDRCHLGIMSECKNKISQHYEWSAEGIEKSSEEIKKINPRDLDWLMNKFSKFEVVNISRNSPLPHNAAMERELWEKFGYSAFLGFPLYIKDVLTGFLVFITEVREKEWEEIDIKFIKMAGDIFANVLARKEAKEALIKSERKYRELYNSTPVMLHSIGREGYIINVSDYWLKVMGYERHEVLGRKSVEFTTEKSRNYALKKAIPEFMKKGYAFDVEYEFVKKNGEIMNILMSAHAIKNEEGEFLRSLAVITDITGLKKTEEALMASEHEFRRLSDEYYSLLEAIPQKILLLSPELDVLWANSVARSYYISKEEKNKKNKCYKLMYDFSSPCEDCPVIKSVSSGREEENQFLASSGRYFDIKVKPIKDEKGKIQKLIVAAHDITEKMNLQKERLRTAQLASLGELAAGVAHEINNPVNSIVNYGQIILNDSKKAGCENEFAFEIIEEGKRIASIVKSLLFFAREDEEEKCLVSVPKICRAAISLLNIQLEKDGIVIENNLNKKLPPVMGNFNKLQQVFLNILVNSRYALNKKYKDKSSNKIIKISGKKVLLENKSFIEIIFFDCGTGIPENIIDKVLNPFFTTKPPGDGTGLGLSISYGIIKDHGGKISIKSKEDECTEVKIILPVSEVEL